MHGKRKVAICSTKPRQSVALLCLAFIGPNHHISAFNLRDQLGLVNGGIVDDDGLLAGIALLRHQIAGLETTRVYRVIRIAGEVGWSKQNPTNGVRRG